MTKEQKRRGDMSRMGPPPSKDSPNICCVQKLCRWVEEKQKWECLICRALLTSKQYKKLKP